MDSYALADDQVAELERESERFPFVLIGHRLPTSRLHWVAADDRGGGGALVQHLLQLGHRRIVHLYNHRGHPARERSFGYQQVLAAYGLSTPSEWLIPAEEVGKLGPLCASREAPTAVFAWNDYAALAVLRALHEAGLRVPQDVSVAGYADFEVAALALPALTTVREPLYALGVQAAETVLDLLAGASATVQRLLPTELVVRESTAPAPAIHGEGRTREGLRGS